MDPMGLAIRRWQSAISGMIISSTVGIQGKNCLRKNHSFFHFFIGTKKHRYLGWFFNDLWDLSVVLCRSGEGKHTVAGKNPKQPPAMYKNLVNNGINYRLQLVQRRISEPSRGSLLHHVFFLQICYLSLSRSTGTPFLCPLHQQVKLPTNTINYLSLPKIRVGPQNGWVYNGKPYENGWFGGKTHYFRKHPFVPPIGIFH